MTTEQVPAPTTEETDIDPETIQSSVDMSLSIALGLVQSWMPSTSSAPDPFVIQSRKRLEEYMRRPPRLGVGAPLPTTPNAQSSHHETQRLKNRLVGSGAVRRKDEEKKRNGVLSSKQQDDPSDDDEAESRATAMKKRPKGVNGLSVFEGGKKGTRTAPRAGSETGTQLGSRAPPVPTPEILPANPGVAVQASLGPGSEPSSHPTSSTLISTTVDEIRSPSPVAQAKPSEPMGINKLRPKLALAAKIWPQSPVSDTSSKRRKTTTMPPPSSPSLSSASVAPMPVPSVGQTWSLELPRIPASRSASVASSSVPSITAAVEPHLDPTATLSRKERKRLRKAAQQERGVVKPLVLKAQTEFSDSSAQRVGEPESDESEPESELERVSQIDTDRVLSQNDTVRDGKKKRKRRGRKKTEEG